MRGRPIRALPAALALVLIPALVLFGTGAALSASMPPWRDSLGDGTPAEKITGGYLLEQSAAERLRLELTLAGRIEAWPGDLVELKLDRYGLSGVWRVLSTGHSGGGQGLRTTLELGEREITV